MGARMKKLFWYVGLFIFGAFTLAMGKEIGKAITTDHHECATSYQGRCLSWKP